MKFTIHDIFKDFEWILKGLLVISTLTIISVLINDQLSNIMKLLTSITCLCVYFTYLYLYKRIYILILKLSKYLNIIELEHSALINQNQYNDDDKTWSSTIMELIVKHHNNRLQKYIMSIFSGPIFIQSAIMLTIMIICEWGTNHTLNVIWVIIILLMIICFITIIINSRYREIINHIHYSTRQELCDHIANIKNIY